MWGSCARGLRPESPCKAPSPSEYRYAATRRHPRKYLPQTVTDDSLYRLARVASLMAEQVLPEIRKGYSGGDSGARSFPESSLTPISGSNFAETSRSARPWPRATPARLLTAGPASCFYQIRSNQWKREHRHQKLRSQFRYHASTSSSETLKISTTSQRKYFFTFFLH